MNRRTALLSLPAAGTCLLGSAIAAAAEAVEQAARTIVRSAGPRWNVNGDWTPTAEAIERHLRDAHGIDPEGLGLDDMLALHDNDHNRMGYRHGHRHEKPPKGHGRGYRRA
jgi:hypothetical protein